MWKDILLIAAPIATAVGTVVLATLTLISTRRLGRQEERKQVANIVEKVVSPLIGKLGTKISALKRGEYLFFRNQAVDCNATKKLSDDLFSEENKVFCEDFQEREGKVWKAVESHDDEAQKLEYTLNILEKTIYTSDGLYGELRQRYGATFATDVRGVMLERINLPIGGKDIPAFLKNSEEYRIVVEHHNKLEDISISLKKDLEKIRRKWRRKYKIP